MVAKSQAQLAKLETAQQSHFQQEAALRDLRAAAARQKDELQRLTDVHTGQIAIHQSELVQFRSALQVKCVWFMSGGQYFFA